MQGSLLIASPAMLDPNFRRTVVLVAEHAEEGAMGLVLNRRSETEVAEAVPQLADLVEAGETVSVGGPVSPEAVLILAEVDDQDFLTDVVVGDVGFVRGDADPALVAGSVRRARVFAGYAGWSPEQLEAEMEEESWIVEPARPEDVFADADELWALVLRRRGGPYALLATMPAEPWLN